MKSSKANIANAGDPGADIPKPGHGVASAQRWWVAGLLVAVVIVAGAVAMAVQNTPSIDDRSATSGPGTASIAAPSSADTTRR